MKSKIDLGKRIPKSVIPRLSFYYRILVEFKEKYLSSVQLARRAGFTDAQVRRDLAYFGQFGTRGKGYDVDALKQALSEILGIDRTWSVGVIGVGNLGTAFIKYRGFGKQGFNIVAGFD
ncbi:MAG: redox-sensing transcriptional repressor Rex, partial [Elusimicrobiota bacterium]